MSMSTGLDAIRRKSCPIRFVAFKFGADYDVALNFADQFMERHAGELNHHHHRAIDEAKATLGDRFQEFRDLVKAIMAGRLVKS